MHLQLSSRRRLVTGVLVAFVALATFAALLTNSSRQADGAVSDTTRPPAPTRVEVIPVPGGDGTFLLAWSAAYDETRTKGYLVHRNGQYQGYVRHDDDVAFYSRFARGAFDTDVTAFWEVRAQDTAGNYSQPQPFRMIGDDPTPFGLELQQAEVGNVGLNWDQFPGGVSGYEIQRNGAKLATVGAGTTSYTDTSVGAGDHRYQVFALKGGGPIGWDGVRWESDGRPDGEPPAPAAPSAPSVSVNGTTVDLSWNSSDPSVDHFRIFRFRTELGRVPAGESTFTIDNEAPGRHVYRIEAVTGWSGADQSPFTAGVVGTDDGVAPNPPSDGSYDFDSEAFVWSPVADPDRINGFTVHVDGQYRTFVNLRVESLSFPPQINLSNLDLDTAGWYRIDIRSQDGFDRFSSPDTVWVRVDANGDAREFSETAPGDDGTPGADASTQPAGVESDVDSNGRVTLTWDAPASATPTQKGALVHRNGNYVAFIRAGTTTWTDAQPLSGGETLYEVRYQWSDGSYSDPAPITVDAP